MFSTILLCLFYFWGPLATFSRPPLGSQDPSLKTADLMYLWLSQSLLLSSAHIQPVWEGPSAPQHPLNAHSCGTGSKPNPWCLCSPWHLSTVLMALLSASMPRRPGVALVSFLQSCLTCTWCLCLNIRLLFNSNQVSCCLKWPRGLWEKNDYSIKYYKLQEFFPAFLLKSVFVPRAETGIDLLSDLIRTAVFPRIHALSKSVLYLGVVLCVRSYPRLRCT